MNKNSALILTTALTGLVVSVCSAQAQGWEEAAVAILAEAGKQIAEANSPTMQKLRGIDNQLGQINAKLDHITDLLIGLPGVVTKVIQDHSVHDTQAAIKNRFQSAAALMDNYPAKEGPDRAAFRVEILRLVDSTNENVSYLLDAGSATYPSVGFGILLSTAMYKAISQKSLMTQVITQEIGKFEYVTKVDPVDSLVAQRAKIVKQTQDKQNYLLSLPRYGTTGCRRDDFNGNTREVYFQNQIEPNGIPNPPALFSQKDKGATTKDSPTDRVPAWLIGTDKWKQCSSPGTVGGQAHGGDALAAYNAALADFRNSQNLILTYDKYLQDVDSVTSTMLQAAGLTQQQVDAAMKPPTAASVISRQAVSLRR